MRKCIFSNLSSLFSCIINEYYLVKGRIKNVWSTSAGEGIQYPCSLYYLIFWLLGELVLPLPALLNSLCSLQHHISASFCMCWWRGEDTPSELCHFPCVPLPSPSVAACLWWSRSDRLSPCTANSFAKQCSTCIYLLAGLGSAAWTPQLSYMCLTRLLRSSENSWQCGWVLFF